MTIETEAGASMSMLHEPDNRAPVFARPFIDSVSSYLSTALCLPRLEGGKHLPIILGGHV
jgi:hypothetical protein